MRFIFVLFFSIVLSYLTGLWLPWWSLSVSCFLVGLAFPQNPLRGFLSAFLAIFLLWGGLAFIIDIENGHILSRRMSQIFFHHSGSVLIVVITALAGAIIGGFSGLLACQIRYRPNQKKLITFGSYFSRKS